MGIGDNIMATGLARGARARGKIIAFGDGKKIRWDHHSAPIFWGNPNIAPPGSERRRDIEWVHFYKGYRQYNRQVGHRWEWNEKFKATPGELFFKPAESAFANAWGKEFVLIEPNVPNEKGCAPNKQWPIDRFDDVARKLKFDGHKIVQFSYPGAKYRLQDAIMIPTPSFRHAAAVLKNVKLAILPEGGLHHAAAAVGLKAVVLFGGFIPPSVTGYDLHKNLTGGAVACGSLTRCNHCVETMEAITVEEVMTAAQELMNG